MKVLTLTLAMVLAGCTTTDIRPISYLASTGFALDASDHQQANGVLEGGSENKSVGWGNPRTGNKFTVTPTRTFKKGALDCRDYTAVQNGSRFAVGTACRRDDGSWFAS